MDDLFLAAAAGFMVAVLFMDLLFDVLALGEKQAGPNGQELTDESLSQICGYYYRTTTTSWPLNLLISAVPATMVVVLVVQLFSGDSSVLVTLTSMLLLGVLIGLAVVRIMPSTRRLATREETLATETHLATAVLVDHLLCMTAMLGFLAVRFVG